MGNILQIPFSFDVTDEDFLSKTVAGTSHFFSLCRSVDSQDILFEIPVYSKQTFNQQNTRNTQSSCTHILGFIFEIEAGFALSFGLIDIHFMHGSRPGRFLFTKYGCISASSAIASLYPHQFSPD